MNSPSKIYTVRNDSSADWLKHPFYDSALVVAIDIGIRYIAVWLRLGGVPIFYRTYKCPLPTANALKKRREKRGARRCRKNQRHRDYLLRIFCKHYGLPVDRLGQDQRDPFRLRLDAVTDGKGLKDVESLVICIQHLIHLRGFDYHLLGDEGSNYPWGDDLDYQKAKTWAESGACPAGYAEQLQLDVETLADWKPRKNKEGVIVDKKAHFFNLLDQAVGKCRPEFFCNHVLKPNLEAPKAHARPKARDQKIPRELVKAHLAEIWDRFWKNHAFPGGAEKEPEALVRLIGKKNPQTNGYDRIDESSIIDYHRKNNEERTQHAAEKTKICPYYKWLFPEQELPAKCDKKWNADVRRFFLLEFLIQSEVVADSGRRKPTGEMVKELLDFQSRDAACFDEKGKQQSVKDPNCRPMPVKRPAQKEGWFKWYEKQLDVKLIGTTNYQAQYQKKKEALDELATKPNLDANEKKRFEKMKADLEKLKAKSESREPKYKYSQQNECYFEKLKDLLQPELSKLNARASMCAASGKKLFQIATDGTDFSPSSVLERLKRRENFPVPDQGDYFNFKRDPERASGFYPQVEFLLGRRKIDSKTGRLTNNVVVKGKLRQILNLPEVKAQIAAIRGAKLPDEIIPDYAVVEVVRHAPKTDDEIKEIIAENKENRDERNRLIGNYGLSFKSSDTDMKRARCHSQQRMKDGKSTCPLCLEPLSADPLDVLLELDHIYPEEWAGISELVNLVLVHGKCNRKKDCNTPFLAGRAGLLPKSWQEIAGNAALYEGWGKAKRNLFTNEEFTKQNKPDWNNFTRQSQIARQLFHEIRHWLGFTPERIPDATERNNKATEHVGSPGGFLTKTCRDAWETKMPEFMRGKKDRSNLRNHLYDAAVLSYILPGVGMNVCGGIFAPERRNDSWFGWKVRPEITSVVPDFAKFDKDHKTECLVEMPRAAKSKKKRFDTSIYPPPFLSPQALAEKLLRRHRKWLERRNRKLKQRHHKPILPPDELEKSAHKKAFTDFQRFFRDENLAHTCYTEEQLPASVLQTWFDGDRSKLLQLADGTPLSYLFPVQYIREKIEDLAKDDVSTYDFIQYFRCAGIKPEELPDKRIEEWLKQFNLKNNDDETDSKIEPVKLKLKNGTPVLRIPAEAKKTGKPHSQAVHRDGRGNVIGAKGVAQGGGETNWRLELWEAEGLKKPQSWVIPHPRMLALLRSRGIKWTDKYPGEKITWRQKFCGDGIGLLPNSKRMLIQGQNDKQYTAHFTKGDKALLTIDAKGEPCMQHDESKGTIQLWYRITSIYTDHRVVFELAELKTMSLSKEDRKAFKENKPTVMPAEKARLAVAQEKSISDTTLLLSILKSTYGHDQSPHPFK
jgi:hypothetical protein